MSGGLFRVVGKGLGKTAAKTVVKGASQIGGRTLLAAVTGAMRAAFKNLSVRSLKFPATTAERLSIPGRHVPVHILQLAIKYGRRTPDPKAVKGAFLYTSKMLRNGREYILEIVVREKDWTILHFLYK
jgi:hypothetical protein